MRLCLLAAILLDVSLAAAAPAQILTDPPSIIQLVRKPGIGSASLKPYAGAGAAVTVIGMAAVTGLPGDVINLDRPDLAYHVISGAPSGTILFLAPLQTLRNLDDGINPVPVFAEGLAAARVKDGSRIAAETEISREHLLFRVEPRISYVSSDFADVDPEFWRGKKK